VNRRAGKGTVGPRFEVVTDRERGPLEETREGQVFVIGNYWLEYWGKSTYGRADAMLMFGNYY
jgi:hypothetical protein